MEGKGAQLGIDDDAALDNSQPVRHTEAQAFEEGGQMPGIDQLAIDRGLPADGFQSGTVEERRQQRVSSECLVEPRDGAGGARQRRATARPFARCRCLQIAHRSRSPRGTR
jgi:hypothetical protein